MVDQGPTPINQLVPYERIVKIKVRICRIWWSRFPGMTYKYTGLHCILVDERCLSAHRFFLLDYNRLYPRLDKLDVLTIQRLEPIQVNQRIDHKCDRVIQNINPGGCSGLGCVIAYSFTSLSFNSLPQPITAVFTSLKVKLFAAQTTSSSTALVQRSSFWPHPVRTLPPSNQANEAKVLQIEKKVTIEELSYFDPDLYKDDTFLCKASIKRFNIWYERYKVFVVFEDDTNEINALIIGKSGDKVVGVPCKDLVFNQRSAYKK
ncbi:hypothetical protein D8674_021198 [Pyrus ussuriensis x Pyrus communis]|uniref:Uncharacterized protein n=1 Tax=Pyrus ussuriensis x Pyrus communis TaxID=2448454 RepID=A0A5N5HPZ1_9ROSA|nr:hypothetical protein D8674_021198 [Pyrus ussuriensis x Pyrus communis]